MEHSLDAAWALLPAECPALAPGGLPKVRERLCGLHLLPARAPGGAAGYGAALPRAAAAASAARSTASWPCRRPCRAPARRRTRPLLLEKGRRLRRRLPHSMQEVAKALRASTPRKTLADFRRQRDSEEWRCFAAAALERSSLGRFPSSKRSRLEGLKRENLMISYCISYYIIYINILFYLILAILALRRLEKSPAHRRGPSATAL